MSVGLYPKSIALLALQERIEKVFMWMKETGQGRFTLLTLLGNTTGVAAQGVRINYLSLVNRLHFYLIVNMTGRGKKINNKYFEIWVSHDETVK